VQPNWSPHGHRIAYWGVDRSLTGRRDLWTVPADGSGPSSKVLDDEPADWNPVWSGDGQYLYFVSDRSGVPNTWRVALNEQTGRAHGEPEPLAIPAQRINGISVARDGRLAFAASDRRSTLARLAFDSAGEKVVGNAVVVLQTARRIGWDDWSPDGTWLTFTIAGTADNLYVIRADGTGYRQLTNDTGRNRGPRWTRDGSKILFYSNRAGAYQLWTINVDGSGLRQLTNLAGGVNVPLLSPDGVGVVFTKAQPAVLAFLDLRHADRETIWPTLPGMTAAPAPSSWSKDGSRLAGFTSSPENRMFVYTPKSGTYRDLGPRGADPHWLSDERRLLFHDENRLIILDTESGRTQELFRTAPRTTIPNSSFSLSPDERQVALILIEEQSDIWMINPNRSDRTP
jgi:Tol biopolymer transport system component